jgi:hypothetical protein
VRDLGGLESAVAQPKATFDATDPFPTLLEADALGGEPLGRDSESLGAGWQLSKAEPPVCVA